MSERYLWLLKQAIGRNDPDGAIEVAREALAAAREEARIGWVSHETMASQVSATAAAARREAVREAVSALDCAAAPLLPQTEVVLLDGRTVTACDGHAPEYEFWLKLEAAFRRSLKGWLARAQDDPLLP